MVFPCVGLDAPGRALRCMGVRYELAGLWEIHEPLSPLLRNMYPDQQDKLHVGPSGNVLRRRPEDVPDADGLVSGPPCQWVSSIGQERLWRDKRSAVFLRIIQWIQSLVRRGLLFFVLENVDGVCHRRKAVKKTPLHNILRLLKRKLPSGWQVDVWKCNSWVTAQSRRRVYIIGHLGFTQLQQQPVFPRMSLASLLYKGLPNAQPKDMCKTRRRKFSKYIKLLGRSIHDLSLSGRVACFSADRDPRSGFAQVRLDDASLCIKSHCPYFVVSLGERGGHTPRICRFLHLAELCNLQGVCPE